MSLVPVPDKQVQVQPHEPPRQRQGIPPSLSSRQDAQQAQQAQQGEGQEQRQGQGQGHAHRHDSSLQGLLSWVIEETAGDGRRVVPESEEAARATAQNLDEERKQFLEKFLSGMTGRDHLSAVKEALSTLLSGADASEEDKHDALEIISEEVEDINIAVDFLQINGLAAVTGCLQNPSPGMQWRAAEILAHLTQNNPKAQEAVAETDLVSRLVRLLGSEDDTVRLKVLSALSSMVRGCEKLLKQFLEGPNALPHALQCLRDPAPPRLRTKAIVFLRHLLRSDPSLAVSLAEPSSLSLVTAALKEDAEGQLWEHGVHLLRKLAAANNALLPRLREHDPAFLEAAENRRRSILELPQEDKAAHDEELEHMQALLGAVQL